MKALIHEFLNSSVVLGCIFLSPLSYDITINDQLKVGAFTDTYYAYDINQPENFEREYTTQPVRSNEFNLNLASLDITYQKEKVRSRLALQTGNSVTKNTAGEPQLGATSGSEDAKIFQEAFVGIKVGDETWIDMGINLGHIGMESWVSSNNYTYSRSLTSDYTPYYATGIRLEHEFTSSRKLQFHLVNGWQNMSENNQAKASGFQYWQKVSDRWQLTYNNFFGDEEVVSSSPRFRGYHNFVSQYQISDQWPWLSGWDFGHQASQESCGTVGWFAFSNVLQFKISASESVSFRAKYYNDRHEANVVTKTPNGFVVISSSVNYDRKIDDGVLWRTELRGFSSKDKIYPHRDSLSYNDLFMVTSLAISL